MKTNPRFWARVDVRAPDECWMWQGALDDAGYGQVKTGGKQVRSHVYAWVSVNGPVPSGLQVNHKCDVKACANPAHLYAGTQAQNMLDKVERGRCATGQRNGSHTQPHQRARGSRVGGAKLTEIDAEFIRHWFARGHMGKDIASAFGVTQANVSCIRRGQTWAHVK